MAKDENENENLTTGQPSETYVASEPRKPLFKPEDPMDRESARIFLCFGVATLGALAAFGAAYGTMATGQFAANMDVLHKVGALVGAGVVGAVAPFIAYALFTGFIDGCCKVHKKWVQYQQDLASAKKMEAGAKQNEADSIDSSARDESILDSTHGPSE